MKRYQDTSDAWGPALVPSDDGEYVRYDDAAQQIEALRTALDECLTSMEHFNVVLARFEGQNRHTDYFAAMDGARAALQSAKEGQV